MADDEIEVSTNSRKNHNHKILELKSLITYYKFFIFHFLYKI